MHCTMRNWPKLDFWLVQLQHIRKPTGLNQSETLWAAAGKPAVGSFSHLEIIQITLLLLLQANTAHFYKSGKHTAMNQTVINY